MLGSDFRKYLAYDSAVIFSDPTACPLVVDTLVDSAGANVGPGAVGINDLITAGDLLLADELKDVTEAGNPNTINTTTRSVARSGVSSSEITTTSRDLNAQYVYEPHSAFQTPVAAYTILDVLEICEEFSLPIFVIDLDKALGADGGRGAGANYTVSLSQTREVEGQVIYEVTFALKNFYQRVERGATLYQAKA